MYLVADRAAMAEGELPFFSRSSVRIPVPGRVSDRHAGCSERGGRGREGLTVCWHNDFESLRHQTPHSLGRPHQSRHVNNRDSPIVLILPLVRVDILVTAGIVAMLNTAALGAWTIVDPLERVWLGCCYRDGLSIHHLGLLSHSWSIVSRVDRQLTDLGFKLRYLVVEVRGRQGFTEFRLLCGLDGVSRYSLKYWCQ